MRLSLTAVSILVWAEGGWKMPFLMGHLSGWDCALGRGSCRCLSRGGFLGSTVLGHRGAPAVVALRAALRAGDGGRVGWTAGPGAGCLFLSGGPESLAGSSRQS